MLGLRGTLARGAHQMQCAGSGVTLAVLLAAPFLLAACQVPQQTAKAPEAMPVPVAESPEPEAPDAEISEQDALPKQTPLSTTPAVAHGDAILPTARLTGEPAELLGLDHATVRRVLGKPAQVRHEVTAQVWQYVTGDCVVDLYLYDHEGALKVTYLEARSRSAEQRPTTRCLKSLLERPTALAQ
jgi:hypothetical protein